MFRRYPLLSPLYPKAFAHLSSGMVVRFFLLPKEAGSVVPTSQMRESHIREIVYPGQVLMSWEGEDRGFGPQPHLQEAPDL